MVAEDPVNVREQTFHLETLGARHEMIIIQKQGLSNRLMTVYFIHTDVGTFAN